MVSNIYTNLLTPNPHTHSSRPSPRSCPRTFSHACSCGSPRPPAVACAERLSALGWWPMNQTDETMVASASKWRVGREEGLLAYIKDLPPLVFASRLQKRLGRDARQPQTTLPVLHSDGIYPRPLPDSAEMLHCDYDKTIFLIICLHHSELA